MTIHIAHERPTIVVPFDNRIATLLPHATQLTLEGKPHLAFRHGVDETKLLRNLGYDKVPSPIVEHYSFPSVDGLRPFDKQVLTASSMVMNPRSYVLNGYGTGKTKAALWAHDYLQTTGLARVMLVTAPLSTVDFTWAREAHNTFPHKKVVVLTGSAKKRKELLKQKADIFIINHDGVKVVFDDLMKRGDIDIICFDEASAYRNAPTDRSKMARKLARGKKYIWAMTGSPTPNEPTDAYGLAHLVNPSTAPRSYVQFRHETMVELSKFRWVPRRDHQETVAKLLQPAVRFSLDDIVELPDVIERVVQVPMGQKQRAVYKALEDHAAAMLQEGTITAANGGVVFSKMLQTSLGWVYGNDNTTIALDNNMRLALLLSTVQEAEQKVIIFSPFKSATRGISTLLTDNKVDFAEVTGDTPHGERSKIFHAFQNTEKYRVLNAHPECMSHGLTLTRADTIIWFGPTSKLETYDQANARIRRVGQRHKQQIVKFAATALERLIYSRLQNRHEVQESILDLLAAATRQGDA